MEVLSVLQSTKNENVYQFAIGIMFRKEQKGLVVDPLLIKHKFDSCIIDTITLHLPYLITIEGLTPLF